MMLYQKINNKVLGILSKISLFDILNPDISECGTEDQLKIIDAENPLDKGGVLNGEIFDNNTSS